MALILPQSKDRICKQFYSGELQVFHFGINNLERGKYILSTLLVLNILAISFHLDRTNMLRQFDKIPAPPATIVRTAVSLANCRQ